MKLKDLLETMDCWQKVILYNNYETTSRFRGAVSEMERLNDVLNAKVTLIKILDSKVIIRVENAY